MRCVYISIFPYSCKTSGGWKHISGMCIKPNISNSILIFVSNICQVEPYFWDFHYIQIFIKTISDREKIRNFQKTHLLWNSLTEQ